MKNLRGSIAWGSAEAFVALFTAIVVSLAAGRIIGPAAFGLGSLAFLIVSLAETIIAMPFSEALARYGTDRPDLRIPFELVEVADLMRGVEFKVFAGPANTDGSRVAALRLPGGSQLTRQQIDGYTDYVRQFGAGGLAYIKVNTAAAGRDGLQSPILKFLPDEVISALVQRTEVSDGDLLFFGADTEQVVNDALGALRVRLGHDLGQVENGWQPLWVVDFPLVERDRESGRWQSTHHPFTAPRDEDVELLEHDPGAVRARAYDMVLNGTEIGGGSIRIHRPELQESVFQTLGIDHDEANVISQFLVFKGAAVIGPKLDLAVVL